MDVPGPSQGKGSKTRLLAGEHAPRGLPVTWGRQVACGEARAAAVDPHARPRAVHDDTCDAQQHGAMVYYASQLSARSSSQQGSPSRHSVLSVALCCLPRCRQRLSSR
eukprot:scaffold1102_cov395-Prasinococcus_capsulatus_cf.AAC.3